MYCLQEDFSFAWCVAALSLVSSLEQEPQLLHCSYPVWNCYPFHNLKVFLKDKNILNGIVYASVLLWLGLEHFAIRFVNNFSFQIWHFLSKKYQWKNFCCLGLGHVLVSPANIIRLYSGLSRRSPREMLVWYVMYICTLVWCVSDVLITKAVFNSQQLK